MPRTSNPSRPNTHHTHPITPPPSRHHPHTPPITLHPSHPPITPHPSCTPTPIYLFAALPTNPTLIPLGADFKTEFLNASLDRPYGPPPLRLKDKRQKSKKVLGNVNAFLIWYFCNAAADITRHKENFFLCLLYFFFFTCDISN